MADVLRMDLDDEAQEDGLTIDELVTSSSMPSSSTSTAALVQTFETRKLSRSLAVPTNDLAVRLRLRDLGEPASCFGEANVDRRERLREVLVKERQRRLEARSAKIEGPESDEDLDEDVKSESEDEGEQEEEFFTEGDADLLEARRDMAWYSLARAKERLQKQSREAKIALATVVGSRRAVFDPLRRFTSLGSQPADERPISIVRFSPDGQQLATGSWSGALKLWNVPSASHRRDFRGHTDKVGGVAWHPRSTLDQESSAVNLVSGAADHKVCLWSLESDTPLHTLSGHAARVARVAFHPGGNYVASASFDGTWRLWDLAKQKELLLQEGHSKEVYAVEFQGDGALCASGGLDAIGRLWDLRTGRTSMVLDGHAKEILSIDFHPNGYQVATASGDDTVRIWDLRTLSSIYTIPAHKSSVADVRFFKGQDRNVEKMLQTNGVHGGVKLEQADAVVREQKQEQELKLSTSGMYLATAGYDGLLKIWSADDWQLLRSLSGDNGKVMSCDIQTDGEYLASGDWGRTFKLWGAL